MKVNSIFFLGVLLLGACNTPPKEKTTCNCQESCKNNSECQCWCSQECRYRDKTAADHPVYVENDQNGKGCYCKQWDLDYYEDNCINHQDVKQPPNAN